MTTNRVVLPRRSSIRVRNVSREYISAARLEAIAAAPKFRARPVRRAVLKGAGDAAERAKAAAEQRRVATRRAKEGVARKGGWDKQLGRKRGAEAAADEEERAWGLPHRRVQELSQAVVVAPGAVVGARIRRQRGYPTAETEA